MIACMRNEIRNRMYRAKLQQQEIVFFKSIDACINSNTPCTVSYIELLTAIQKLEPNQTFETTVYPKIKKMTDDAECMLQVHESTVVINRNIEI